MYLWRALIRKCKRNIPEGLGIIDQGYTKVIIYLIRTYTIHC
jgi:hypothetical protein